MKAGQGKQTPLVLFLDLDGTVIGDIMHLLVEKEVVSAFSPGPTSLKAMKASHISRMRYGVIRPRLDAFLRKVEQCNKSSGQCIELFIYTASEHTWALYICSVIEAAVGFTFNKPIFTRKNCHPLDDGTFYKTLAPLLPAVVASLRRKGYSLSVASLEGRVALVDNTPGVIRTQVDRVRLITCPTYNFVLAFDVLRLVDVDVLQEKYESVARLLASFGMYPIASGLPRSCRHFLRVYYSALASRCRQTTRAANSAEIRDKFWARLRSAVLSPKLVSSFDASHVKTIEKHVKVVR